VIVPAFDLERSCVVVRIVYDGPAFAGKTTNLARLCELFPVERRSELYTPGALKGRTMFFDWMEIDGGRKGRHAYRFQLLTVPGQAARSYRRRPLLRMADAVVFVCDASPSQLAETRRSFSQLKARIRERGAEGVPLVVQVNKQDAEGAHSAKEMARLLRLDPSIPVVSAVARAGQGVRETILTVVREAVQKVNRQLAEHDVETFGDTPGNADDLFMQMLELEDTSEDDEADAPDAADEDEPRGG
jgi:signal recognition particle receptor subunit beta